jgi:hypothetical protein
MERKLLLREQIELPIGLMLATQEFREGWNFVPAADGRRLEKRVQNLGWNFVGVTDGMLRSGVGKSSRDAIDSALKLALRRVSEYFNAVQVERIQVTTYPWFVLARIRIFPYRIQEGAVVPIPDGALPQETIGRKKQRSSVAICAFPDFGRAMPGLREMLVLPQAREARVQ